MKSTLFASTLAAALTGTSFGHLDVFQTDECCEPWDTNWDGTTLSFYQPLECYGFTEWEFDVYEETIVTYQLEWLPCESNPRVTDDDGGIFSVIQDDWYDQGNPTTWSGTFTLNPGFYGSIRFWEFQGTLTFCKATDTDGDGVSDCNDGCPTDPNKTGPGTCGCGVSDEDSDGDGAPECIDNCPDDPDKTEPGNCGCGVPETDVFGDLDCDGDYDIDDARLAMTTFGIEEAEEDTCPADVDGDGSIGFSDVLIILNDWGVCP